MQPMSIVHEVGIYHLVDGSAALCLTLSTWSKTVDSNGIYIVCSFEIYPVATSHGMQCPHINIARSMHVVLRHATGAVSAY